MNLLDRFRRTRDGMISAFAALRDGTLLAHASLDELDEAANRIHDATRPMSDVGFNRAFEHERAKAEARGGSAGSPAQGRSVIAAEEAAELFVRLRHIEALLERIATAVEPKPMNVQMSFDPGSGRFADAADRHSPVLRWWTKEKLDNMVFTRKRLTDDPVLHRDYEHAAEFLMTIDTMNPTIENLAEVDRAMVALGATEAMKVEAMQHLYNRAKAEHEGKVVPMPEAGSRWLNPKGLLVIATAETKLHRGAMHLVMRDPYTSGEAFALFPLRTISGEPEAGWHYDGAPLEGWRSSIGLPELPE